MGKEIDPRERVSRQNWFSWVALTCGLALILGIAVLQVLPSLDTWILGYADPLLAFVSFMTGVVAIIRKEPMRWWAVPGMVPAVVSLCFYAILWWGLTH